jgi:hypothetical protein
MSRVPTRYPLSVYSECGQWELRRRPGLRLCACTPLVRSQPQHGIKFVLRTLSSCTAFIHCNSRELPPCVYRYHTS